jgi:glycosyltransferase involved in cell wall biosynthesis
MSSQAEQQIVQTAAEEEETPIHVALLVDKDYLYRFRSLFAHMLVGLVDQPINVTLVCPDPITAGTLPIGPARIIEFKVPLLPWKYKQALARLAAELKAAKVNLIHSCSGRPCWLATDLAKATNLPYVVSFTGLFQEECYTRLDHSQCGRLVGISQPICETLHDLYGKANDRIELIRPGCFLRPRKPRGDQPKTLLSIGSFTRNSGYDVFLRALAEVKSRGLECWTILFGRGPMENELHRWVNKNGLGGMVSFIDIIPNWEEVLSDIDFYVQPGPFYTLHSGPYEAMSYGCPIIAPEDTAFDLLKNSETGRTFKTGDYKSLANVLTEWLEGKFDWQTMSDNAIATAKSELSLFRSTEKVAECYRSVLKAAAKRKE